MLEDAIGRRVREARDRAGMRQAELARQAQVEKSALCRIEGGQRRVTAGELWRIATALGVPVESLCEGGDGSPEAPAAEQ